MTAILRTERGTAVASICVALLLLSSGCLSGGAGGPSTEAPESTPAQTAGTPSASPEGTDSAAAREWNATVDIRADKTSFAAEGTVFNGWNVSVRVTEIDGADRVVYVYEAVNVVEGNSTRPGVVGNATGDTTSERSLSLLQRGGTVTVYAVKGDERKRIGFIEIESSYVAPWDGERGWSDSWRGEPPEDTQS